MISSRQNPLIKRIKSLSDKKNRDRSGQFVVDGLKSVKEAISCGFKVETLVFTEKGYSLFGKTELPFEIVTDDVFSVISEEKTPQGVLAVCEKKENAIKSPEGNCILLDDVKDPSNVGAIIRTAAATDFTDVYLIGSADPFSSKCVRASMGGIFKVRIYSGKREEILSAIDKPILIADMKGENVFTADLGGEYCLAIGNEGHGVSEEVKKAGSVTVSIPMQNRVESLNAAVSAGILMYALIKKS